MTIQTWMSDRIKFAALTASVLSFLSMGCATDQARKLRAENPTSIGSDLSLSVLGGEYRLRSNPDIGIDFGVSRTPYGSGYERFFQRNLDDAVRETKITGRTVDIGASWYPSASSAFRTGLHLSVERAQIQFNGVLKDENIAGTATRVTYDRQATYIGIPIGWHWIWENRITLGLDVGPRLRVSSKKTIKEDGGATVSTTDRDDYISRTEDARNVLYGGLITYIGYSF